MTRDFRSALSCFATGVTVVTTHQAQTDWGMTCNSFTSVSLSPQMVLWSIRKNANSHGAFTQGKGYTVNVLAAEQEALAHQFATGTTSERFVGVDVQRLDSGRLKLTQALAWFDCNLVQIIPAGDHDILLGEVSHFGWTERTPLLFAQSKFAKLAHA
ncbi:MAG: flavin reductase family protein [Limnohabitans sp.]|nr:flavin reductase family protein [Limnohabitans sp.]